MVWTTAGNLRGPQGVSIDTASVNAGGQLVLTKSNGETITAGLVKGSNGTNGENGASVQSVSVLGDGTLQVTLTTGSILNAGAVKGERGEDGTSVTIAGSVVDAAALPTNLTATDNGDGYITQNDGHLHVWDGDSFNDVGSVKGPKGDKGDPGNTGARGSKWFVGTGTPNGTNTAGSLVGDMYLDQASGDIYQLS